ncbi:MAG: Mrp/NBP35 family ATP-binding protein [Myxococcota bacterium]|nr:Mrp/NBP35 family ATP-binding protein [Myxococcota bacterium]
MSSQIKNLILVASAKGGVGKSTVAVNLALSLRDMGYRTGLLDADVYGPSIPTMLGKDAKPTSTDGKNIIPVERFGIKLMSMGYMVDPNTAMIWRGPMLAGAVTQFVNEVEWGELDYLVFDLPPGTGDIQLTLAQRFKVRGALMVTTPQEVALVDVIRGKAMFDKVRVPILGLVENMSYFICPHGDRVEIFAHGGGQKAAKELGLNFFGEIPIETNIRICSDDGTPIVEAHPDSDSSKRFAQVAQELDAVIQAQEAAEAAAQTGRGKLKIITH